jgi:transcriptional regulator with XRE-family HTH domain
MELTEQQTLMGLREEQRLSVREMANTCGIDTSRLSRFESGVINNLSEETDRKTYKRLWDYTLGDLM